MEDAISSALVPPTKETSASGIGTGGAAGGKLELDDGECVSGCE